MHIWIYLFTFEHHFPMTSFGSFLFSDFYRWNEYKISHLLPKIYRKETSWNIYKRFILHLNVDKRGSKCGGRYGRGWCGWLVQQKRLTVPLLTISSPIEFIYRYCGTLIMHIVGAFGNNKRKRKVPILHLNHIRMF